MANQATPICKGGPTNRRCFWELPAVPAGWANIVRSTINYYLRTNPETGVIVDDQWATYPNNATPRKLAVLVKSLRLLTDHNRETLKNHEALEFAKALLVPGYTFLTPKNAWEKTWNDQVKWEARLSFYEERIAQLLEVAPDMMVGQPGQSQPEEHLARYVVDPLLNGWYPNDLAPFKDQGMPYGHQLSQAGPDMFEAYRIANQAGILNKVVTDNFDAFVEDLKEQFTNVVIPTAGTAGGLVALGIALGLWLGLGAPGVRR